MAIMESIKSGVDFTVDTVSELAAVVAEKNRIRSQLNYIKKVIKTDSATRDQAYIELGRFFYENMRENASAENEAICAVIDTTSERISKASLKYMELVNLQNETKLCTENTEKIKKIVAEKASVTAKAAKEKSAELGQKAKEYVAGLKDKGNDIVDEAEDSLDAEAEAEVEQILAEEQAKVDAPAEAVEEVAAEREVSSELEEMIAAEQAKIQEAEAEASAAPAAPAEESPESFDF